ncbi:MAG: YggT family protein [Chloroflexi bacterium]|nr:YggT family protein [Chloroflexota bacterium]
MRDEDGGGQTVTNPYDGPDTVDDETNVSPSYPDQPYRGTRVVEREVRERPEPRPAVVRTGPSLAHRLVVLVFGLIQLLILLRIVLLLVDAVRANPIVAWVLDLSQLFVAPFVGILRTNALSAGGSTLDVAAIVALIGWTIAEMVVLAIVNTVVDRGALA